MFFHQLDQSRRLQGRILDALGLGPTETPSRIVFSMPVATLLSYRPPFTEGPVLLIIPAPIKRAYIWDLAPGASAVQQCLGQGIRVYLIRWELPSSGEQGLGLAQYADRVILACLGAIEAELGPRRVFLAGHSLGGTFAAMFSSLHPEKIQGLILLGAPLHFGPHVSHFGPLVALAPRAQLLTPLLGNIPGTFLNMLSVVASPASFQMSRWMDLVRSLTDANAFHTHLRVERWTLDEMPIARRLFEEIVEWLYRENRFMRGTLVIQGKRAAPDSIKAPVLSVMDRRSLIVPPQSVLPFHRILRDVEQKVIPYEGDVGVALQHVGMLVGRRAHQALWPEIVGWLRAHHQCGVPGKV